MRAPLRKLTGRAKGSSRNVRHDQPVRHARLEMLEYADLSSRHADRTALFEFGTVAANISELFWSLDKPSLAALPFFIGC